MASTYSNLKIQLMTTGENTGTWGTVTNTNLGTALEEAITGSVDVTFASADVTLTLTNTNSTQPARNLRLNCTGTTGGSARNLILGSGCQIEKVYIVNNGCGDTITIKNTTGNGIAVPSGKTMYVFNTGTNVVDAITHLTSLTLASPLPVASGGTGSATAAFSGENITNLNASNIASGTIANARTTAASANGASTIVARDASGNFSANTITANLTGTAANATVLQTARTIAIQDGVTGTATSFNGSANISIPVTGINASVIDTGTISNARTTAASANGASTIVARDASGNFSANTVTANLSGNASTATTLATARNFEISGGATASAVSFNGSAGVNLSVTGINASVINTGTIANARTTASSTNGASTIVARDASGNFSANTITAALNGNASTATSATSAASATTATTATQVANSLTLATSGTGLSGSATFNGSSAQSFTVTSNASSANGASTIVARDASGNFSANTITATLSGNATNVTGIVAIANGGTGSSTASFSGANITTLNASNISSGTLAVARMFAGSVLQIVQGVTTAVLSTTSSIPLDDTVPTDTEGSQWVSQIITPSSASNKVLVIISGWFSNSISAAVVPITIFRSSTCIYACSNTQMTSGYGSNFSGVFLDSPATTSSVTYSSRFGASTGTSYINAPFNGISLFGAAGKISSITLIEVKG